MITTGFVNLYTDDIEAALAFWRDLLGFEETFRTPREGIPTHVELVRGGFELGLGTSEAARRVHGVDPTPGSPSMAVVLWTEDLDAAHEALAAAGVPVLMTPHETGNNNRNALFRGPDGVLVEVVAKVRAPSEPTTA